jgi:hypothetical protein
MRRSATDTPPDVAAAFELGYLAAISRLRRQLPAAWRGGVLAALTDHNLAEVPEEPRQRGKRSMPHVHGFKLILMRCESAAAMLTWRKQLTPEQQNRLRESIDRLAEAAAKLGCA